MALTNLTKNQTTWSMLCYAGGYLTQEDGFYILQENGDKIIVGVDINKHSTTWTNISKTLTTYTN